MKVTLFLSTRQNQCGRTEKKKNQKPVNQEYRMTCTSEWNPAPVVITWAVDGSQRCVSLLFLCYSSRPPWKKACRFPWRQVTSAVRGDTPDSPSSSSLPLCFIAARGITAPKSFFPAAALGYGKKGIEIPEDFSVHSMWKAAFALSSAPLLHVLSSSRLRFPLTSRRWSLLLSLFLLYWLVPSDSDLRLWVWSHADSSFFFSPPHCAPMPPRSPLGCSCFTFAL